MAETQNSYVVVALGAFWHRGELIEAKEVFEATRKERITLVAAKSVRDATDKEIDAFRAGDTADQDKTTSKTKPASTKGKAGDAGAE